MTTSTALILPVPTRHERTLIHIPGSYDRPATRLTFGTMSDALAHRRAQRGISTPVHAYWNGEATVYRYAAEV